MEPLEMPPGGPKPGLQDVERLFETNKYYAPEMLIATRAMLGAIVFLRQWIADAGAKPSSKVMMCTVNGDMHNIGKYLCNIILEGAGFGMVDIGVKLSIEDAYIVF